MPNSKVRALAVANRKSSSWNNRVSRKTLPELDEKEADTLFGGKEQKIVITVCTCPSIDLLHFGCHCEYIKLK